LSGASSKNHIQVKTVSAALRWHSGSTRVHRAALMLRSLWKTCYNVKSGSHVWVRQAPKRVKAATDTHEAGQVVQTVTTRRVVPVDQPSEDRKSPEFWAYLEALDPSEWERHLLYVYRRVSDSGPLIPLDKCSGYIAMPDRSQIALNNREEVEFAIANKFGGGIYRLILKRNRERITEGKVVVDGPPKHVQPISEAGSPSVTPMTEASATADVAHHAINTVANQDKAGMQMGMEAMGVALNVIKSAATAAPPAPSESDQMMKLMMLKMMEKLVDRMDAPAPVPVASNGGGPIVEKILNTAVERMLNPPSTGPVSSAGAELVRTLPSVASHVGEAIREWRMGMEAQAQTALVMSGKVPPTGVVRPPALPAQPAPPTPQSQPGANMPDRLEFIETKIIEIMADADSTTDAAEECFDWLHRYDRTLTETLVTQGEAGLMQLFQTRQILKQATNNLPALTEFIKAFLKYASKDAPPPPQVN
jgi:hypothetical protein